MGFTISCRWWRLWPGVTRCGWKAESGKRTADGITLECDEASVPRDEANLIVQAARLFCEATGWREPVHFRLEKRIPLGAGLGGGSSDGTAALRGLDLLAGHPLAPSRRLAKQPRRFYDEVRFVARHARLVAFERDAAARYRLRCCVRLDLSALRVPHSAFCRPPSAFPQRPNSSARAVAR